MAHFAFLDGSVVVEVIVGRDEGDLGMSSEEWERYYGDARGLRCVRTSYNTRGGVHLDGGKPFRLNYAGIGYTFDPSVGPDGAFLPPETI